MIEILTAIVAFIIVWGIWIYNRLVRNRNRVREGWSDIDVQLKLRHNLIPNLVAATKQYANYEQAVLTTVVELRSQSEKASAIGEKAIVETKLANGLQKLVALVEQYPDLKANENFTTLQNELVDIEEQIQYARRYYNGAVRDFNTSIEHFPNILIAKQFNFELSDFFQLEADDMRQPVKVN